MLFKAVLFTTTFLSFNFLSQACDIQEVPPKYSSFSPVSYTSEDVELIRTIFDQEYYRKLHGKNIQHLERCSQAPHLTAIQHFMSVGWTQNYNPNSWFNVAEYKKYFPGQGNPVLEWLKQASGVTVVEKGSEEVVFSLTTHPPRIGTTWLSLSSLIRQSKKPNRIILNLADSDFPDRKLPLSVQILMKKGVEVHFSKKNYKVATKLLPTLKEFPNAVIITADDDRLYAQDWAEILLKEHAKYPRNIIAPSARDYTCVGLLQNPIQTAPITYGAHITNPIYSVGDAETAPPYGHINYLEQKMLYDNKESFGIFEGFTGVLYPPHSFNQEVFNFENFKLLTPYADDVWFQVMAMLNGTKVRGLPKEITERLKWPSEIDDTQAAGLFHDHLHANDWMAYRAMYYYGVLSKIGVPAYSNLKCQTCKRKVKLYKPDDAKETAPLAPIASTLTTVKKGKRCPTCLNTDPKKILCVGAYDYGNIGDNMYSKIFKHYFGADFDVFTVPDTERINTRGQLITFQDKISEDLDFDALIVGGGGILKDLNDRQSYYINCAIKNDKPFFIASAGIQTSQSDLDIVGAKKTIGKSADLLKQASLIFARSQQDYFLLRAVLGEDVRHKIFGVADLGYLFPLTLSPSLISGPKQYVTLIQTGSANIRMEYIRNKIQEKMSVHPGSQLVIMNWGGIEDPSEQKDFAEWDLFQEAKRVYPNAKVYMGDSYSSELKELKYK